MMNSSHPSPVLSVLGASRFVSNPTSHRWAEVLEGLSKQAAGRDDRDDDADASDDGALPPWAAPHRLRC